MTWTSEKPTVLGWYWYRENLRSPFIVEIEKIFGELETMDDYFDHKVSELHGEWAGPLEPPEEG